MGKISQETFFAGGKGYTFNVYSTDTSFNDFSAVYMFAKRTLSNNRASYSYLYVGETGELGSRIEGHEKWDCVNACGCNCICVHRVGVGQNRRPIEKYFRDKYSPPCNDE